MERDIIKAVTNFFWDNFSNEFGYVTEKVEILERLSDRNWWVAYNMLDYQNKELLKIFYLNEEQLKIVKDYELSGL